MLKKELSSLFNQFTHPLPNHIAILWKLCLFYKIVCWQIFIVTGTWNGTHCHFQPMRAKDLWQLTNSRPVKLKLCSPLVVGSYYTLANKQDTLINYNELQGSMLFRDGDRIWDLINIPMRCKWMLLSIWINTDITACSEFSVHTYFCQAEKFYIDVTAVHFFPT